MSHQSMVDITRAYAAAQNQQVKQIPLIIPCPPDITTAIKAMFGPNARLVYQRGFGYLVTTKSTMGFLPRGLDAKGMKKPDDHDDMALVEGVLIGGQYDDWGYIRQWIAWQKPAEIVQLSLGLGVAA